MWPIMADRKQGAGWSSGSSAAGHKAHWVWINKLTFNHTPLRKYQSKRLLKVKVNPGIIKGLLVYSYRGNLEQLQLFLTSILRRNISWAPNQHIRIIFEASHATEDWSSGFLKIKSCHHILKYIILLFFFLFLIL